MSTIAIAPAGRTFPAAASRTVTARAAAADAPQASLRLTVRGRRVIAALVALPLALLLGFAAISGGSALASRDAGAPVGSFATVTVRAGETLWSIAEAVAPEADPRDVVASIQKLNALPSSSLVPGQRLAIPAAYSAAPTMER